MLRTDNQCDIRVSAQRTHEDQTTSWWSRPAHLVGVRRATPSLPATYAGLVASRDDIGSWLDGTPQGEGRRGWRLGLPGSGPGSMAPLGRRLGGLLVDWLVASLISLALFDYHPMATLAVFAVENILLVSSLGFTIGHRVFGIMVRPEVAHVPTIGFLRGAIRGVLLCLVIPAVVWDADGRGMHDKAARTVIVRR